MGENRKSVLRVVNQRTDERLFANPNRKLNSRPLMGSSHALAEPAMLLFAQPLRFRLRR